MRVLLIPEDRDGAERVQLVRAQEGEPIGNLGRQLRGVGDHEVLGCEPEDVLVETTSAEGYSSAEEGGYLVGLDTTLTEALEREGLARELVRTVQEARRQVGLDVSDRIILRIEGTPEVAAALDSHRDYLMEETLAAGWGEAEWSPAYAVEHTLGTGRWSIGLARVNGP